MSRLAVAQRRYKNRVVSSEPPSFLSTRTSRLLLFSTHDHRLPPRFHHLVLPPTSSTPHTFHETNPLTMKFMTAFAALLSASTTILAAPVDLTMRDVWVPKILYPTEGTVWHVGETQYVKWALDQKPESVTNPNGKIFLSKNGRLDIGAFLPSSLVRVVRH